MSHLVIKARDVLAVLKLFKTLGLTFTSEDHPGCPPHWSCGDGHVTLLEVYPVAPGKKTSVRFQDHRTDREQLVDAVVSNWWHLTSSYFPDTVRTWADTGSVPDHGVKRIQSWWRRNVQQIAEHL